MTSRIYWLVWDCGPAMSQWSEGEGLEFLSPAEQARMAGLRFPKRRYEWLSGRFTAKRLLKRAGKAFSTIPEAQITVANRESGAPYVVVDGVGEVRGQLSISHRDLSAASAWCSEDGCIPGVDLELIEHREDSFLTDYFTPEEQAMALTLAPPMRDRWITMAWSVKEAVLKVLGTGLRIDTRTITVVAASGFSSPDVTENTWHPLEVVYGTHPQKRILAWWLKWGDYVLTLAVKSQGEGIELYAV